MSLFAGATAQRGSSLIPGLPIQRPAAPSPTPILHNSHESGLIYSQEIQTLDTTSKGLFICMKKGIIPKIFTSPPLWGLKILPQDPVPPSIWTITRELCGLRAGGFLGTPCWLQAPRGLHVKGPILAFIYY